MEIIEAWLITLLAAFALWACMMIIIMLFTLMIEFVNALISIPVLILMGVWWIIKWTFHKLRGNRDSGHIRRNTRVE